MPDRYPRNGPEASGAEPVGLERAPPEDMREVEGLLRLSELAWRDDLPLPELCQEVVDGLRESGRSPEVRCARVELEALEVGTANCGTPRWVRSAPIRVGDAVSGLLQIGSLKARPDGDEDAFPEGEQRLLEAVADHLGRIVARRRADDARQRRERSFKKASQIAKLGYWDWDVRSNDLVWSDAVFHIYGLDPERDVPTFDVVTETLGPECRDRFLEALGKALESDVPFDGEYRIIASDGSERFTHTTGEVLRDPEGHPVSVFGVIQDITDRKRAESELRLRDDIVRDIAEGIYLVSMRDLTIVYANRKMEEMFGYEPGEMTGKPVSIINAPSGGDPEERARAIAAALEESGRYSGDVLTVHKDGSTFWTRTTISTAHHPEHGDVFLSLQMDISKRKEMEEALRDSERRFRELFEHAGDYILVVRTFEDRPPVIVDVNGAAATKHGYAREELVGKPITLLDPTIPEDLSTRSMMAESGRPFEVVHRCRDGSTFVAEAVARPVTIGGEQLYISIERDITERKRAEEELRASEEKFQKMFRSAPALMAIARVSDGVILEVNDRFCEVTGYGRDEILGLTAVELGLLSPEQKERMAAALAADGRMRLTEIRTQAKGGRPLMLLYAAEVVHIRGEDVILSACDDITQTKEAEERLQTLQKLESLGTLAGGIAHDFNNLLTGIIGNLSLLREELDGDSERAEILQEAEAAGHTAKGLARQLLTFAAGGEPLTRSEDLRPIVREAATFAARGSNVRCVFEGWHDPVYAQVDRDQVAQVIQNLVINAVQAMPTGGVVRLDLGTVDVPHRSPRELEAGRYAHLTIADSGVGIPDEVVSRVFDPYFSTKSRGRGLGLAVCHSIVARHGGRISVKSKGQVGTAFTVYLPTSEAPASAPKAATGRIILNGKRILVMDDEPAVATVLQRMLRRLGADVEVTADGASALEAYRRSMEDTPFTVVIADLTVPGGMGGKEMAEHLRALDPAAKVIVSSGYSTDPVMADHRQHFAGVLSKPYQLSSVAEALSRVLNT